MQITSVKVRNGRAEPGDYVVAHNNRRQHRPIEGVVAEVGQLAVGKMYVRLEGAPDWDQIGARWFEIVVPLEWLRQAIPEDATIVPVTASEGEAVIVRAASGELLGHGSPAFILQQLRPYIPPA